MGQYTKISLILLGLIIILAIVMIVKANTSKQYYGFMSPDLPFFTILLIVIALLTVSCIAFSLLALFREKNLIVLTSLLPIFFAGMVLVKSFLVSNHFLNKTQEKSLPSEQELLKSLQTTTGINAICVLENAQPIQTSYLLEIKEITLPKADEENILLTITYEACHILSDKFCHKVLVRERFISNEQGGYDVEKTDLQTYLFVISGNLPVEKKGEYTPQTIIIKDADKEEYYLNLFDYATHNSGNH